MKVILEKEAEDFLEKEGFKVANRDFVKRKCQLKNLKLKYPLAIKVSSQKAIHKAKVGGVKLNIKNLQECEKAFNKMRKIPGFEGVVVQEMIKGKFTIIGLKKTPEFGLAIMFGAGGGKVEKMKDVAFRICPIQEDDADNMIKETRISKELDNINDIKSNLLRLSTIAKKHPNISELDINPLIVNQKEAVVVDARIVT